MTTAPKRYRTLLFDLDDTLLDIGASRVEALRAVCEAHDHPYDEALYARFNVINEGLWREYEAGRVAQAELMARRHVTLFSEYGREVDGHAVDATYREHLSRGYHTFAGSLDLVRDLRDHFSLYVVSNGASTIQDRRLRGAGLHDLFHGVFVSEDTGHQKPHAGFFDHVFARIPGFAHHEALIIGDSLSADIVGGYRAGIDTCWFNPDGKPNHVGVVPTYEVRGYAEVRAIVGVPAR